MDIGKIGPRALIALLLSNLPALAGTPVIYFSSYNNSTIYSADATGAVSVFVNSGLHGPGGLAWDSTGNLYTANWDSGTVSKITPQGVVTTYASGFNTPWGLAFDTAGNLYVSNAGGGSGTTVSKIAPTSPVTVTTFATGLHQPMGLAFDTLGNLYVANRAAATISRVTSSGGVATTFATLPSALGAHGIGFDSNGYLFASILGTSNNGYVGKIDSLGTVQNFAPTGPDPLGLHLDAQDTVYLGSDITVNVQTDVFKITPNAIVSTFAHSPSRATDVIPVFVFNASWNGTVGNWSEGPKWSTAPTVPNNGQSPFNVTISAGTVSLNISPTISSLNIIGSGSLTGSGNITFDTGNITGSCNITGTTTVNSSLAFGGATQSAGKITGAGSLQVNTGSTLTSDGISITGAWNINGVHIIRPGNAVARLAPPNLAGTVANWIGKLDLTTNSLILTGATNVNNQIAEGAALGKWNGTGGITSSAARDSLQTSTSTALASATGAEFLVYTLKTSFLGQTYQLTDTLIMYTLAGDANMDQSVTFADFLQLQNHYNQALANWQGGDFNYDGSTTFADFLVLQNNYNKTFPAGPILPGSSTASDVPEPTSLILLSLAISTILSTRHRRTRPSP